MTDVAIVAAVRTAIGAFGGALKDVPAHRLGSVVIAEALARAGVAKEDVDEVLMGQVLTAAQGQNPARQAAIAAGIPAEKTAMTINQVCGSGLRSVALAVQAIQAGDATVVVAGGQENMSLAPHAALLREGVRMGPASLTDTMIVDGLWDAFNDYHMGITAENVAEANHVSREEQDIFAFESQKKAADALAAGVFDAEIVPVEIPQKKGEPLWVKTDEHPRLTPLEKLAGLKPAFKKDGTVTAASSSGINDGAAAVVLMPVLEAEKRGLKPLAVVKSWATCGLDPKVMGCGPIYASRKALEKAQWHVGDLDVIEANEAFAAQAVAVNKAMGWDVAKVNKNGGAIALGHPIGASGARCLVTLLHEMQRCGGKKGLVTLCIGGGMGIAMCVER